MIAMADTNTAALVAATRNPIDNYAASAATQET